MGARRLRSLRPGQSLDGEPDEYDQGHPSADPDQAAATRLEPAADSDADVVAQPTWQIMAPDGAPAAPSVDQAPADAVAASAEPQWPTEPEWPSQRPAAGLPFLGRPATPTGGIEALWAESAREVAATKASPAAKAVGGIAPCVSCGLSLSANARFCRRCGSRQG